ncbi:uncharacterized protein Z520_08402 [Fonsecaea multimorphosa CBS 102226]|uniref:Chromo domain-containing protein n=1 Tax=Fonsecaea multimorphosa CBS 102226 TaxID=1442371 RepID=A0A0D2H1I1_9EURO|nr:uncharacterized protein Z520_08402 [Fonsecaea multimorphosa CBS 102226]KIX95695.1 hypothetical protein Z520_08402 [Fonsecaea multimorphosa CBS 102226]OAL21651.1 hypothetical protein AYO22_07828 [Fonsecaea multimorphosa]
MPHGFEDIEDADDIFHDPVPDADKESKKQVNGELKRKADDAEEREEEEEADDSDDEDIENEEPVASKDVDDDVEDEAKGRAKGEDEYEDEDDEDDEEEVAEYSVEAIRDHKFVRGVVYYYIKWQGYSEKDNTWEPEEHLLPHARQLLAAYHEKLGGAPVPPTKRTKSKQKLREQPSSEDLAPPPKRRRRKGNDDVSASPAEETELGTWLPNKEDWEGLVVKVETVERDETGQLLAYISFKNGKRSKVGMDMVYRHCPRPMLKFYEEHLKFK